MNESEYREEDVREFARAIADGVKAVKEDGLGVEDAGAGIKMLTTFTAAANEAKEDTIAFLLHLSSELTNIAGDLRRASAELPPAA